MKMTKRIAVMAACAVMAATSMVGVEASATDVTFNNSAVAVQENYSVMPLSSAHENTLTITGYSQEKSNWCWVACTRTVLKFLKVSPLPTQTEIYKKGKNVETEENETGDFVDIKRAIKFYTEKTFTSSTISSFNNISDAIRLDKIVIVRGLKGTSTEGHDLVVYGFEENEDEDIYVLKIYDPSTVDGGYGTLTCTKGTSKTFTWTIGDKSKTFTATNYMYGK